MDSSIDSQMDTLQKNLFQWSKLDKELKELNKQCAEIRKKKEKLQAKICPLIQSEQLEDNIFSISSLNMNICYKEQKTSESISYKFLEEKFNDFFDTPDKAAILLQYIKDNRKQEVTHVLKSSLLKE